MSGICERKTSGVSLRPALYCGSIASRNVGAGVSNAIATNSGISSVSTLASIDVNPNTALVIVPSRVDRSVGSA